jgi:hypothetical protein
VRSTAAEHVDLVGLGGGEVVIRPWTCRGLPAWLHGGCLIEEVVNWAQGWWVELPDLGSWLQLGWP